jgi:hypothetical protein
MMSLMQWGRRGLGVVAFLAVLGLMLSPLASAQSQGTGQIVGTVYDASGASVPGAKVSATGKATGLTREVVTNQDGGYRVVLLPPGTYSVEVKQTGFKSFKSEINVSVGSAITVDARLQVGQVTEVVEVTATTIIETTAVQTDALINQRSINELPINGRRFQEFVQLTPTVQIEPSRNGISFAGQRGINANITIDGHDYNQPFFGGIRGGERSNSVFTIPQESISEFQIVPYGFSAEFGRSSGGIMNAVTKSGTNDWHGSGFYFVRHKDLSKKDAFNRQSLDSQHQFGGAMGGPVRKDKSFVFVSGEDQLISNPRQVIFPLLDPVTRSNANGEAYDFYRGSSGKEAPFTQTNDGWTVLGRWDEQLTANHRVGVRYHYSTNTAKNAVSAGGALSPNTTDALSNNGTEGDSQHTVSGQWTGIFTSRLVNEFRSEYSREQRPRLANALQGNITNVIGRTGTQSFLPTTQHDWRFQLADSVSWNIGRHSLKFGGDYQHLFATQFFKFNQFGLFNVSGGTAGPVLNIMALDPTVATDRRFDDTGVAYRINVGNGLQDMSMDTMALFFTDTWRITPRFTLIYGGRWEGYLNPQPNTSNTTITPLVTAATFPCPGCGKLDPGKIPNNLNQFMPRLGIAWDPWGNGKTVLRANAGMYYAVTPLILFATPLNNFRNPPGDATVSLPFALPTGYVCTALYTGDACNTVYSQFLHGGINLNTISLSSLPTLTGTQLNAITAGLGLPFNPFTGLGTISLANNYESPRSWQWNMALEHEIARGWTVGGDLVYINTVHLQRNRDWNLPAPTVFTGATVAVTSGALSGISVAFPSDASLRPCFGISAGASCTPSVTVTLTQAGPPIVTRTGTVAVPLRQRPIPSLGSIQVRETSARALYRAFTLRTTFRRPKYQFQAYFTRGKNLSDDDNERDSGGQSASNSFDYTSDYSYSRLDVKYLFVFNSTLQFPWGMKASGLAKLRSGRPVDASTGSVVAFAAPVAANVTGIPAGFTAAVTTSASTDPNRDLFFTDRPFSAPGVPYPRNSYRDRATYNIDFRVAKEIKLPREGMRVDITVDFFNLFNYNNVLYGSSNKNHSNGISATNAAVQSPSSTFLQLYNPAKCLTATNLTGNKSCYDTSNTPGLPFQMQVGVRFQF